MYKWIGRLLSLLTICTWSPTQKQVCKTVYNLMDIHAKYIKMHNHPCVFKRIGGKNPCWAVVGFPLLSLPAAAVLTQSFFCLWVFLRYLTFFFILMILSVTLLYKTHPCSNYWLKCIIVHWQHQFLCSPQLNDVMLVISLQMINIQNDCIPSTTHFACGKGLFWTMCKEVAANTKIVVPLNKFCLMIAIWASQSLTVDLWRQC